MTILRKAVVVATGAAAIMALGAMMVPAASAAARSQGGSHSHVVAVQVIPAFDHDFPVGKTSYRPSVTGKAPMMRDKPAVPAQEFICSVYASDPYIEDGETTSSGQELAYVMGGDGSQACSGSGWQNQKITVAIQTYIGLGFWDNRVVVPTNWSAEPFIDESAYWDCTGSGTQTYRIVTTGWAASGDYGASVQSQNDMRVTCAS